MPTLASTKKDHNPDWPFIDDNGVHLMHAGSGEAYYWIVTNECSVIPHFDPQLHDFRLIVLPPSKNPLNKYIVVHEKDLPEIKNAT